MFNVVLCNSYLLSSIKPQEWFRVLLYQRLLQVGASSRKRKWVGSGLEPPLFQQTLRPDTGDLADEPALAHRQVHRAKKEECQGCRLTRRTRAPTKRRVLDLSLNTRHNSRPKRSSYGCLACDVALCKEGPYYEQYHDKYVNYQDLDQEIDVENHYP
jgi:hypothetical protein